jgi:hypothetical protein
MMVCRDGANRDRTGDLLRARQAQDISSSLHADTNSAFKQAFSGVVWGLSTLPCGEISGPEDADWTRRLHDVVVRTAFPPSVPASLQRTRGASPAETAGRHDGVLTRVAS